MIDLISISIIKLAEDLNVIEQVRCQSMRQYEPTAKLVEVLEELARMVGAFG